MYIRKLSFSPSISGQMDSYLHHCDYTIKGQLVKKWVLFVYGKGVKFKKNAFSELFIFFFFFFFWLNSRISLTGVHPDMKLGGDIDFGDTQGIGLLKFW